MEAIVTEIEREKEAGESYSFRELILSPSPCSITESYPVEAERKRTRQAATAASQAAMNAAAGGQ